MPKVRFTLKNVHYAVIDDSGDTETFGTPKALPGSVALAMEPQGDISKFYADGVCYWQSSTNNGYQGDLEVAAFPDTMLAEVWGMAQNADKVVIENANTQPKRFALLYEIVGDTGGRKYCMYNCLATRPGQGANTQAEQKTPQTQKCSVSATPMADGRVMAKTTKDTSEVIVNGWFKSVYTPANGG